MSEERSAKLKLKRKKCVTAARGGQDVEVRLPPSSALSTRQDFTGSWFDEIELTAAEEIWKQVLGSACPDLSSVGWGAVPGLPDVNLKVSDTEKETINTEVFKVGDKKFEWFPLPSALPIDNAEKPCAPEIDANQQKNEDIKKPLEDARPEIVQQRKPPANVTKLVSSTVRSEDSKRNTEGLPPPQNGSTKNGTLPLKSQKSASENANISRTLLKSASKKVGDTQTRKGSLKPPNSQKGPTKRQSSQKPTIHLWATVTSVKSNKIIQGYKGAETSETEEEPQPNDVIMVDAAKEEAAEGGSRGQQTEEPAEKSADATKSLDTCPICLMQFPKQFSQLDMDSHLAQCLSETTVDVVW